MAGVVPTLPPLATLPAAPAAWAHADNVAVLGSLKPANQVAKRTLEPAGRFFQAFANRRKYSRTFSEQERVDAAKSAKVEVEEDDEDDEEESEDLLSLDPKQWKDQDHYAVLGLSRLRYKATDEDFKRAYRRKVLKHHPDKNAATHGGRTDQDSFFKCIQKAYDVLTDPVRRLHFDSVDPTFDETIPTKIVKGDFFKTFGPVFESNARFSKTQPVPLLGDANSTYDEVMGFYDFWYNFDSWRVFNYLDEEDSMNADNRDNKRYLDKKNKKQREEHKKEDNVRMRTLVDTALSLDPRMPRIKAEEKERKAREKESKRLGGKPGATPAASGSAPDPKKAAEEEKAAKAAEEKAAKEAAEEEKRQREAKKKALQKERKTLRRTLKARNFLLAADVDAAAPEMTTAIARSEQLCTDLGLEELTELNAAMINQPENAWKAYMAIISRVFGADAVTPEPVYIPGSFVVGRGDDDDDGGKSAAASAKPAAAPATSKPAENAKEKAAEPAPAPASKPVAVQEPPKPAAAAVAPAATAAAAPAVPAPAAPANKLVSRPWADKEISLLIQAVKQIPPGSRERWLRVTKYVNDHSGLPERSEKEIVNEAKTIQKDAGNAPAIDTSKIERKHNDTVINDAPTQRVQHAPARSSWSAPAAQVPEPVPAAVPAPAKPAPEPEVDPWTPKEMEDLQAALRACPPNMDKRWDAIAARIPSKTRPQIMSKVKKISQQLKEKEKGSA